jgi:hypothetical protein
MAHSPSEKWEDGVLVERAIETNRWKVNPDGTAVGEEEKESTTKAVSAKDAENKSIKAAAKK